MVPHKIKSVCPLHVCGDVSVFSSVRVIILFFLSVCMCTV